ncbi:hypothetical protein F5Y14DRAFT_455045 [Nemania sp. NC0429]|nr:hypothetical protein F5Y14DRAFT_455045 [Nemania sp. NC0429]
MLVATAQRSSSLDSLIISHEEVTTESNPNLTTSPIRSARKWWLSAFSQAATDLRSSKLNWKLWIVTVFLVIGFKFTLSLLLIRGIFHDNGGTVAGCDIGGSFSPFGYHPNRFAFSEFFQINLGLGDLTFTQAKVIDTSWDLVVGRGGQLCLAWVSWRLFADCATVSLATQPLSFTSFHAFFLESEPSIFSLWSVAKSFITQKRLASKLTSAFIIFGMSFILAWPTLTSAATGYTPITKPVIRDRSSELTPNLISFWKFRPVAYIIHDFWRIDTLNTSFILREEDSAG